MGHKKIKKKNQSRGNAEGRTSKVKECMLRFHLYGLLKGKTVCSDRGRLGLGRGSRGFEGGTTRKTQGTLGLDGKAEVLCVVMVFSGPTVPTSTRAALDQMIIRGHHQDA